MCSVFRLFGCPKELSENPNSRQRSDSLKMCNILEESCSPELKKNSLLLRSETLMEKPFWSDGSVELNVLERPLEIVVKSEWITSWLWCATFINPHRTLAAQCQRGGMARVRLGMGALVWSIDGKSSRDTNQYFQGQMKIPRASKLVVSRSWAVSLSCHFPTPGALYFFQESPIRSAVSGSLYHRDWKRGELELLVCSWEFGNNPWLYTYSRPGAVAFCFVPH